MRPRYADLFKKMRDPDLAKSDAAFDAVLFDREQALPDIIECYKLAESDHILRFYAIQLLGFSGSPNAVDTLIFALNDPEPMVRAEACRSLEDIGLRTQVIRNNLKARLDDIDGDVSQAAEEALLHLTAS
jgi:HEAT repeat protein